MERVVSGDQPRGGAAERLIVKGIDRGAVDPWASIAARSTRGSDAIPR
jgi:hypothetical protein